MLNNTELQYFYFGFYRILKRYRVVSFTGWTIAFAGCVSVPLSWNLGRTAGLIEVVLTILTIAAGLVVVWQNISALEEYLRVPFPFPVEITEYDAAIVNEIRSLMKDIDDGGWREAYAAIGKLKEIQVKHALPKVE
jgi:hypothetical protein